MSRAGVSVASCLSHYLHSFFDFNPSPSLGHILPSGVPKMKWIRRGRGSPFRVAPGLFGASAIELQELCAPNDPNVTLSPRRSTSGLYGVGRLNCITPLPVAQNNIAPSLLGAVIGLVRAPRFLFDSTLGFPGEGPEWREHVERLKENDPTLTELK